MLEHTITTSNPRLEEYKTDALGNRYWSRRHGSSLGNEDNPSVRSSTYDAYGRLLRVADPVIPEEPFEDIARHDYDEAGRLRARAAHTTRYSSGTATSTWIQEMHYYNGDGRLALLERHNDQIEASPGEDNDLIERYRYDALGRRVLVHTLRGKLACRRAGCESTVRRFAWDGDNLLYETRGPAGDSTTQYPVASWVVEDDRPSGDGQWGAPKAYGTVGYTHAGGIDRPIGLIRIDGSSVLAAFAPHTNWRGLYELGTDEAGVYVTRSIGWPGKDATAFIGQNQPELPYEWFGSLITEQADASGLLYRRNRYYDPATGRFTQPDPIGLAGGLNLYGFASGDPVNFSDPFGLCPPPSLCLLRLAVAAAMSDTPAPGPGDVVAAALVVAAGVSFAIERERRDPLPLYHRYADAGEAREVRRSGELWGGPPRNIYASDIPQVKAYTGPLPEGAKGIEFTTPVAPDPQTAPGRATWSGPRPGVRVEDGTAKIPVHVTKIKTEDGYEE
jgi:RHS repeat-associated protein